METEKKNYEVCEGFLFEKKESLVTKAEPRLITGQEMTNGIRLAEKRELAWTLRQA